MSILVENFTDPNNDGYFLLGFVPLQLSVEDIQISRTQNDDEIWALRSKYPMILKNGTSRLDVTISWKALQIINPDGSTDMSQWEDVRTIVAMFRCSPFIQVENQHVRQYLASIDNTFQHARMGFAMRQLQISTPTDLIDTLQCTLSMTFFNYFPYSVDFAYMAKDGGSVDSEDSILFTDYVNSWKLENLNRTPPEFSVPAWTDQTDSSTSFLYRYYKTNNNGGFDKDGDPFPLSQQDQNEGWVLDYATDMNQFLYQERNFSLGDDTFQNDDVFVSNINVVFSNSLAQMPLRGHQYPTYQHLGAETTTVGVGYTMLSQDSTALSDMNTAIETLNRQFLSMRSLSRKVDSVHRMQSLYVQNQVLNMLGIYSIQPKQLLSETVDNSEQVQAQLIAIHYENFYEVLTGFKVNSTNLDYLNSLESSVDPSTLSGLSAQDANLLAPLTAFYTAKKAHDISYLSSFVGSPAQGGFWNSSDYALITSFPTITAPTSVSGPAALGLRNAIYVSDAGNSIYNFYQQLGNRVGQNVPTYTDYVIVSMLVNGYKLGNSGAELDAASSVMNSWANSQPVHPMDAIFDRLFSSLLVVNPAFASAVDRAQTSPAFKANIKAKGQVQGPGMDPDNAGHGAYADLGLRATSAAGVDFNPASYFVDWNKRQYQHMWDTVQNKTTPFGKLLEQCITPTFQFNTPAAGATVNTTDQLLQGSTGSGFTKDLGIGSGNATGIMVRSNVPGTTMAEAFPTFKLFLYEEDNQNLFYAFDNFYSYSSVEAIEIIKKDNCDEVALIKVSNLAGLLNHRLYDNSADGKQEYKDDAGAVGGTSADGSAMTSPSGISVKNTGAKTVTGVNYSALDKNGKPVPLKYYNLQTGSKIQIRLGFENNPDKLWPVFNGVVTNISEESQMLTIEAQGFVDELKRPSDDSLKTDGWGITSVPNSIVYKSQELIFDVGSILTGSVSGGSGRLQGAINLVKDAFGFAGVFKRGKAYGGVSPFNNSAKTDYIMANLLKNSSAKHFGHWQINNAGDNYIKGYLWQDLPKNVAGLAGVKLGTLYDRSADNIMLNNYLNADGTPVLGGLTTVSNRSWTRDSQGFIPGQYSVPPEMQNVGAWTIIQDVARHYPDYQLLVRPFGFPYSADATLVYAQDNDWYRTRDVLPGDYETAQPNDETDYHGFKTWWLGGGRESFVREAGPASKYVNHPFSSIFHQPTLSDSPDESFRAEYKLIDRDYSYEEFHKYVSNLIDRLTNFTTGLIALASDSKTAAEQLRQALTNLLEDASKTITVIKTNNLGQATPDNSIQPVVRYHFVDDNTIIHNGLEINGSIYNTVKVGNNVYCANDGIPSHHRRLLDCNPIIINPDVNVTDDTLRQRRQAVAASFLRQEVEKMYRGEIVLRGIPSIQASDILMITDSTTGMIGPVRVGTVIHSFDRESGFITIVKPKALVLINQYFTMSAISALLVGFNSAAAEVRGLPDIWNNVVATSFHHAATAIGEAVAAVTGAGAVASTAVSLFGGVAGTTVGAYAGAGGAIGVTGGTISGAALAGVGTGVGAAVVDGAAVGVAAIAIPSAGVLGGAAIITASVLLASGIYSAIAFNTEIAPIIVCPLSRYGRPWYGGLEGYQLMGSIQNFANKLHRFNIDNFAPLIESWRIALGSVASDFSTPSASTFNQAELSTTSAAYAAQIRQVAAAKGVPPDLMVKIAQAESGIRQWYAGTSNLVTSKTGALGIMQLEPATAAGLGIDPTDPNQNIQGGVNLIAQLLKTFNNDIPYAVAAYNSTPSHVKKFIKYGAPPLKPETIAYVKKITGVNLG